MVQIDLKHLLHNGESSGVEFKRDDVRPEQLAKEMAALLNLEGGYILLGVEDEGTITGLTRDKAEEWVMQVCRDHVQPAIIPLFDDNPKRFLPQAGITAVAYPGTEKDYATRERSALHGPLLPLHSDKGDLLDRGLVEQAMDFVRRNTAVEAWIDEGGRRHDRWKDFPLDRPKKDDDPS